MNVDIKPLKRNKCLICGGDIRYTEEKAQYGTGIIIKQVPQDLKEHLHVVDKDRVMSDTTRDGIQ